MKSTSAKIISLATDLSAAFEGSTRDNGETFRKLRADAPEWMSDVMLAAHMDGEFFPMDWIYAKAESAADHIANMDEMDDDTAAAHEFADGATDVHNGALAAWLGLNLQFGAYCDAAADEWGGKPESIWQAIQWGQYQFLRDMFGQIWRALESIADDMPDEDGAA